MKACKIITAATASALLLATTSALGADPGAAPAPSGEVTSKLSPEERNKRRQALVRFTEETLAKLYEMKPDARKQVERAVGYAVFDLTAVNVLLLVGQRGKGVLVDNKSGKQTFMLATRAGTGPGLGYREMRQVFLFKSRESLNQFVLGKTAGGDVSAAVTVGKDGGQLSFNPYIDVYQITDKGFAVEAQWGGTVYRVDPDLN